MGKKFILTILLLCAAITGFSKQADQSVISKVAVSFYYDNAKTVPGLTYNSISIKEMVPTVYNGRTVYYTITMKPGGWIVVAADDAVTPVLAYSFEDNLNTSPLPPQYISWMEKYQKQIDDVLTRNLKASDEDAAKWLKYSSFDQNQPTDSRPADGVAPLILHNWDQGYPYNIYCPDDPAGPGQHPYAGCVATAMCQVMYYYRFPLTGNGQHCYTPSGYPQQCADFGATTYDWNGMLNSLNGARLDNDSAVALLLWHAGVAVNMMYSAGGSGAYSEDARTAMVNYFRFSAGASYLQRSSYSVADWDSILKSNLDKKMPIYYDGYGPSVGHAFNCDGYQGTDHYHFNWGWSGTANGYYYLDNLNPAGYNFSMGEGAIVNLFPDTIANTYPYLCQTQATLTSVAGTFDDGSGPALNYRNNSNCSWLLEPQSTEDSVQSLTINFNYFNTLAGDGIVRIYKGGSTSDSLAGEFSGGSLPPSITINGTKALVTFTSGSGALGQGWMISYSGKTLDWCQDSQTITDSTGVITDGSLHFNYHNYTSCRWKIIPSGNPGPLNLSFLSFRTEQNHDIVSIYDYVSGELLAEYSGIYSGSDIPAAVTANSGQMFIHFTSNQTGTEAGWEARFSRILGNREAENLQEIKVFPNPAADYFYLSSAPGQTGVLQLEICDINGAVVLKRSFTGGENPIKVDVAALKNGMYFLRIITENHTQVRKIVLEK